MENTTNNDGSKTEVNSTAPISGGSPTPSMGDSYGKSGSYGAKGGWKKWIWIYLIIAVVVYGGIYYYAKNRSSSSTDGTSSGSLYGN